MLHSLRLDQLRAVGSFYSSYSFSLAQQYDCLSATTVTVVKLTYLQILHDAVLAT